MMVQFLVFAMQRLSIGLVRQFHLPRSNIKALASWNESKKPRVYFLFGVNEEIGEDAVYIGEVENVFDRLQNHLANKDFWNEVVFFTSKDVLMAMNHNYQFYQEVTKTRWMSLLPI